MTDKETYVQRMNRLDKDARTEAEKYRLLEFPITIAGKFSLGEMLEHRQFYKKCNDLFLPVDPIKKVDDIRTNADIVEFFTFLLLDENDIYKFIINKYCQK